MYFASSGIPLFSVADRILEVILPVFIVAVSTEPDRGDESIHTFNVHDISKRLLFTVKIILLY